MTSVSRRRRCTYCLALLFVSLAACSSGSRLEPNPPLDDGPHRVLTRPCATKDTPSRQPLSEDPRGVDNNDLARFEDVTIAAGLVHCQGPRNEPGRCIFNSEQVEARFPELRGSGVLFPREDSCTPERQTGGVAVGDYDNDDWPDLYFTRLNGPGLLYRNDRRGGFEDVTARARLDVLPDRSNGAIWFDADNDGNLDLLVNTVAGSRAYFFRSDGRGHFREQAIARGLAVESEFPIASQSIAVGDYDNDGYLDVHMTEWRMFDFGEVVSTARLLHNRGAKQPGYFEDRTRAAGVNLTSERGVAWSFASAFADLDGDQFTDLYVASDFGTSRLFWNNGDGTFRDGTRAAAVGTEENGMGLAIADITGDARPDIFVSSIYDPDQVCNDGNCNHGKSGNRLFRNLGSRRFIDATDEFGVRDGGWGWGAAFIDAANTGRLGLVQASGIDYPSYPDDEFLDGPTFYWDLAEPSAASSAATNVGLAQAGPGKGVATLDFDRDGRTDVVIARDGRTPLLYRNVTEGGNHWLDVQLEGDHGATVVGARISVQPTADGPAQSQLYQSSSHFLGQSQTVAHFGLDSHDHVVAVVRVTWPGGGGRVTELRNVAVDQLLEIKAPR